MTSSKLLPCLLLSLLVIFIFINPANSSPDNVTEAQSRIKSKKVKLSLYYESLCPYCRSFIVSQLAKVFNTDLLNIIDLRLVPWGNAQYVKPNKTIICQHGEDECYLNTIHACAINIWPDPVNHGSHRRNPFLSAQEIKHFNFIYCVENQGLHTEDNPHSDSADAIWKACSATSGMDPKLIKNCYDSGYGRKLLLLYATETDDLRPKHLFVPWVTVNNQPLYDQYENFVPYVCNAYKDKTTVKACMSDPLHGTGDKVSISPVCYTER